MEKNTSNDNTNNQNDAKALGVKKDYKLKFTAMGLWWAICTVGCMILLVSFMPNANYLKLFAAAVIAGLILMLILYYLIFPRMDKERGYLLMISKRLQSEGGMSHSLAAEIDAHLRVTDLNEYSRQYYNTYLRLLANYHLNMMNFGEAMRLLDLMDMGQLQEMYDFPSGKQELVAYHHLRIMTVSQMGDLQMLEFFYANASPLFHEYRGINKLTDALIDQAVAMREIAHGRLDSAEQIMQAYVNESNAAVRQDYCTIIGRCAAYRGDKAAAAKLFDEAYSLAKSDFQRESVKRERACFSV